MGFLKSKHASEQDFELNLASIIDCLVLLITYTLVSASFISLGMLNVSIIGPPPASQDASLSAPTEAVSVFLGNNGTLTLQATGKEQMTLEIPPKSNKPDLNALTVQLEIIKKRWPALDSIKLAAAETSPYLYLVQAVETIKQQIPSVAIGDQDVE